MQEPLTNRSDQFDFESVPFYAGINRGRTERTVIHTHNGVEFGGVLEGEGIMYVAGREISLRRGDVFFVDAAIPHWHYARKSRAFVHTWIVLPYQAMMGAAPRRGDTRLYEPFVATRTGLNPVVPGRPDLVAFTEQVGLTAIQQPEHWDLHAWSLIVQLLTAIAAAALPRLPEPHLRRDAGGFGRIIPALNHLNVHFAEPTPINSLASMCNLSRSRLQHVFRELVGASPISYRNQLRTNHGLGRLATSGDTLQTIALECGFQSTSQFASCIRSATGLSPRQYRSSTI